MNPRWFYIKSIYNNLVAKIKVFSLTESLPDVEEIINEIKPDLARNNNTTVEILGEKITDKLNTSFFPSKEFDEEIEKYDLEIFL